ncbi:MAG TPA: nuclear transport factor 2 family protein [Flavisolibacter sp.]|jgi:ketosteroid isomerase-like protein|nr:nuclear transport factor 2 family protein [Flavisolibacter sp.]
MLTNEMATAFAAAWVAAFNSHDLDAIMEHYAEDIEFYSPFITKLRINESGMLQSKEELRQYFQHALTVYPDLYFMLHHVYTGVQTLVIQYTSVEGRQAAETMQWNKEGKVSKVYCHYSVAPYS